MAKRAHAMADWPGFVWSPGSCKVRTWLMLSIDACGGAREQKSSTNHDGNGRDNDRTKGREVDASNDAFFSQI